MKVCVLEACDGFSIVTYNDSGSEKQRYWFSQEDSIKGLVEVFEELGFETEYQEDY